ncbi:diaminopropionate ammonia-lyase [Burkholderia catarinensis]|uniref:diaminopropionate ammonia-lyase n=1 Tax=Burkholderia catarinensis TaxID=1108140 RepID=UPI000914E4A6|nr:diaminopropionate ammonia-lyase [Burkholderia catarinensis]KAG8154448.1 diaminopropionate ammonia-lyase [Burkholderia catarinensis]
MTNLVSGPLGFLLNPQPPRQHPYHLGGLSEILSLHALNEARAEITTWPGYAVTPLVALQGLASKAGLGNILYKDEGSRFGLGSFKALGGAYAVLRYLKKEVSRQLGVEPDTSSLIRGEHRKITEMLTVVCATDGNHGKSVAWGARTFGCKCVIYVHAHVSQARRDAIADYGASVLEVKGTYDDTVRRAADDALVNGWQVISDTSYEGYTEVPRDVMQGYGIIAAEAATQFPAGVRPTHVFVQGGVGGVAASLCSWFWESYGSDAPRFIIVEPANADCLIRSAGAGKPTPAAGDLDTIMAGLACGEVSVIAWEILREGADAFLTVTDEAAASCMRLLADAPFGDARVVAGESAVAGLAGVLLAATDPEKRKALGLSESSVVMLVGTEGATDPALYEQIVGRSADAVRDSILQVADA